jgi:hypothetical protein
MMPYAGAMPVHHSKIDRAGMTRIFDAVVEGRYPLALSPEGQVSYTTDSVPRLEQGAIRIGFGAAERLNAKDSSIPVEILPIAIHSRFGPWGIMTMEWLLRKTEKFTSAGNHRVKRKLPFAQRLEICRDHILEINEKRYSIKPDKNLPFEKRLETVINTALEKAESILGLKTHGDFFTRMYNLRQICWDRIILPGFETLDNLSKVERGSYDLRAGEAWHASRHIELVDFAWYFRIPLPNEESSLHTKVEYVQNLWDFVNRSIGGAYSDRISILPRKVIIQCAPPINLSERLPIYKKGKTEAIKKAMEDLESAYVGCAEMVSKAFKNKQ